MKHLSDLEKQSLPTQAEIEIVRKVIAYRGSWPPAEVIKEQEAALPGSGERLLRWTEKQTDHRHFLERIQVEGNERRMDRGQYFGLISGLACLLCGTYLIAALNSIYGTIAGIAIVAIGVVTPTAIHIARGIGHRLGNTGGNSRKARSGNRQKVRDQERTS